MEYRCLSCSYCDARSGPGARQVIVLGNGYCNRSARVGHRQTLSRCCVLCAIYVDYKIFKVSTHANIYTTAEPAHTLPVDHYVAAIALCRKVCRLPLGLRHAIECDCLHV